MIHYPTSLVMLSRSRDGFACLNGSGRVPLFGSLIAGVHNTSWRVRQKEPSLHLLQILLPVHDNAGNAVFPDQF